MSSRTGYLILGLYPFLTLFVPDPVTLQWLLKHGGAPMPAEVKERGEKMHRSFSVAIYSLLALAIFYCLRRWSIPSSVVGLHFKESGKLLLYGVVTGFAILGWIFTLEKISRMKSDPDFAAKGSSRLWVLRFLLGSFVDEFWRGFCMVGLSQMGYSMASALLMTSVVYGIGHLNAIPRGARIGFLLGGILRFVLLGAVYGILFFRTSSILSSWSAHFLTNTVLMYSSRRAARSSYSLVQK